MTTASVTSDSGLHPRARLGLRRGLALAFCLSLSQCAHSDKKPGVADQAAPRVEWYIASRDPLTYCPKGYALPAVKSSEYTAFVYLNDRRTRFYVPRSCSGHLRQALQLRQQSMTASQRVFTSSESTAEWVGTRIAGVGKCTIQTSLSALVILRGVLAALGGNHGEPGCDAKLLDKIWSY